MLDVAVGNGAVGVAASGGVEHPSKRARKMNKVYLNCIIFFLESVSGVRKTVLLGSFVFRYLKFGSIK